jgi:hypothetical protein
MGESELGLRCMVRDVGSTAPWNERASSGVTMIIATALLLQGSLPQGAKSDQ